MITYFYVETFFTFFLFLNTSFLCLPIPSYPSFKILGFFQATLTSGSINFKHIQSTLYLSDFRLNHYRYVSFYFHPINVLFFVHTHTHSRFNLKTLTKVFMSLCLVRVRSPVMSNAMIAYDRCSNFLYRTEVIVESTRGKGSKTSSSGYNAFLFYFPSYYQLIIPTLCIISILI